VDEWKFYDAEIMYNHDQNDGEDELDAMGPGVDGIG
jgi:hypothetical protein